MAATEFTPELTQDFYNQMSKRISDRGVTQAGQARSEALSRGLGGDPYEASAVGLARQDTQNELGAFDADLGYKVAGLNREERLGKQNRGYAVEDRNYDADFKTKEADKERSFRTEMAKMGYDFQGDQANTENRRSQQSALWQVPFKLGGAALGGWASGGFK